MLLINFKYFSFFLCVSFIFNGELRSNSFDQNSFSFGLSKSFNATNSSTLSFHSILFPSSIAYLGIHIYDSGLLSTIGYMPDPFKNLSPLAYGNEEIKTNNFFNYEVCKEKTQIINSFEIQEKTKFTFTNDNCYGDIFSNKDEDREILIQKYYSD